MLVTSVTLPVAPKKLTPSVSGWTSSIITKSKGFLLARRAGQKETPVTMIKIMNAQTGGLGNRRCRVRQFRISLLLCGKSSWCIPVRVSVTDASPRVAECAFCNNDCSESKVGLEYLYGLLIHLRGARWCGVSSTLRYTNWPFDSVPDDS